MTDTWYYIHNDQRVGPFSLAGLKSDLQKLSDRTDLLVWRNGFGEWQRADNIREVSSLFPAPPPVSRYRTAESFAAPATKNVSWSIAKFCGLIVLLAAAFMAGAFATEISRIAFSFIAPSSDKGTADTEEVVAKALVKMQAELPKKIDDITTLMWVRYEGTKLIYENRLAVDGAKIDGALKSKIGELIVKNVCATAELRQILNLGASFSYVYADIGAKPVMTINMVKQSCS